VEVDIQAKRAGEALDEGHRSGARDPPAEAACPTALPGEDRAQRDGEDAGGQRGVEGQSQAQPTREAHHPLAIGNIGENVLGQEGGAVLHAAGRARRARRARLAGEWNQEVIAASVTVDSKEAAGQVSALEGRTELALHETRKRDAAGALAGQEGLQVVTENLVKYGCLGIPPTVVASRDAAIFRVGPDQRRRHSPAAQRSGAGAPRPASGPHPYQPGHAHGARPGRMRAQRRPPRFDGFRLPGGRISDGCPASRSQVGQDGAADEAIVEKPRR
jgi:hypothetical protein